MILDRKTKILMAVFTIALFLYGVNLWINPPGANAEENAAVSKSNTDIDCSSARENSIKSLDEVNNVKRLLGYIESSVNDIKLTVHGIDRKMNQLPSYNSADRR